VGRIRKHRDTPLGGIAVVKVKDVMNKHVVVFTPEDSIYDAAKILRKKKISGAPVVSNSKVIGVISETDIMKLLEPPYMSITTLLPSPFDLLELPVRMKLELKEALEKIKKASSMRVGDIMTKKVITIKSTASLEEAARLMSSHNINRLPVVERGKLVGIITRGDIIGAM
jgi:CBS domain-containing protein